MAGLMGVTAFLSMWINNSAAANIMIPAALAIVNELQNYQQTKKRTAVINEDDSHRNSASDALIEITSNVLTTA
jgi:di/tricarboxylate transporter